MLTVIRNKDLQTLIQMSGQAIRDFLVHADAGQFKGEAHTAITTFQAHPGDFTDEKLVSYGKDIEAAINYPVRVEIRGRHKDGAAQMVAKGIWGPQRTTAAAAIAQKCRDLGLNIHLKLAGKSSIEFNVEGVDKSLPIHFLQGAFDEVLKEMGYRPGPSIDSRVSKTVIAADGDGTIYDGPRIGSLPTLGQSPVKGALCAYLQAGGIFMLVSGNDLDRSMTRLLDALPAEVYSRVLVAANGGADLVHVDPMGHAVAVSNYRKQALDVAGSRSLPPVSGTIYIGDDGSREGNDYPAFKAVGFTHAVLVAEEFRSDYDPALKTCHVGESLQGTRKFLERFLADRKIHYPQ